MSVPVDTLLHVGDLHFWRVVKNPLRLLNKRFLGNLNLLLRRQREFMMGRAEPFADTLAAGKVGDLLLTGDFTSTSTDEEFTMARAFVDGLQRRGFHIALLAGNHDVYTFEAQRKKRFERYFGPFLPEQGFPARCDLAGGTPVILVHTVCPNLFSAKGRVTAETVEAVAAMLQTCPARVVVAGHYPLLTSTRSYHLSRGRRMRNAEALRHALGTSGRNILYVCGHVHRFSYTRDPVYPALEHLSTGAFFWVDKRQGHTGEFSEIDVCADGFQVFRHTHDQAWCRQGVLPDSYEVGIPLGS